MRYLPRSLALGALRRGKPVEQLLGGFEEEGRRGVCYVAVLPTPGGVFHVRRWAVEDTAEPDPRPGLLFPSDDAFYPEDGDQDGGRHVGSAQTPEEALELAEHELGANPSYWVNAGMLGYEYRNFVEEGRPLGPWSPK